MDEPHPQEAPTPYAFGAYRIVRELGSGTMGVVFEATDERLGQRVAIKMLRHELAANPAIVAHFLREGHAAVQVRHPHVVDVHELGEMNGVPYLVMDLLEGETLADLLYRKGRLHVSEVLAILLPVLAGVSAAHVAGVLHRDLKPSNIMLASASSGALVPKVLDFGISRLSAKEEHAARRASIITATPYYMAPEQAREAIAVDERCDQYALAVIAYEAVTGVRPFQRGTLYERMRHRPKPPSRIVPGLHDPFDHVIHRALSRDRRRRYPSVRALGAALLPFARSDTRRQWVDEFLPARA
jgi:serine/threonine-protein kinase